MTKEEYDRVCTRLRMGWTRGCYAKTAWGAMTTVDDPSAISWCAVGAMKREGVWKNLSEKIKNTITYFNDEADDVEKVCEFLKGYVK